MWFNSLFNTVDVEIQARVELNSSKINLQVARSDLEHSQAYVSMLEARITRLQEQCDNFDKLIEEIEQDKR